MKTRGSITVFFSLILTVITALIGGLLVSARVAAGRAQIALCTDQALYSLLARYDADLLDAYHLFFMDAGYGTDTLQPGKILDTLESDLSYLLTPKKGRVLSGGNQFLRLEQESGAITGYTLASDGGGSVFKDQAVRYMKNTMGIQGVSFLLQKLTGQKDLTVRQEEMKTQMEEKGSVEDYEKIQEGAGEGQDVREDGSVAAPEQSEEEKANALEAVKAMGTVAALKKTSLLNLVLQNPGGVSGWAVSPGQSMSERRLQSGMGLVEVSAKVDKVTSDLLFQEYLLQNLNHYGEKQHGTGPSYGVEYVLQGKESDVQNLEGVVTKLMLLREGANVLHLYMDPVKRAKAQAVAAVLSLVLFSPQAEPVLEAAVIIGWAFVESLVDVRGLMDGSAVPLVKTAENWQVSFSDIPKALGGLDGFRKNSGTMRYEDYLRLLLFMKTDEKKVTGAMDVIGQTMRGLPGKGRFSMDCALDSIEVELQVRSEGRKAFAITEKRSYRMWS